MLGLQLISHLWGRVYYYNIVYHEAARNRLSIFFNKCKMKKLQQGSNIKQVVSNSLE